ncbi:YeeE/YedE thiosulfate transporter family protein [Phocoenobacter skyensis]|uniref:YeeE/YedE thiosulfate transporter family protein n=1 Tax=Phocoenobacter skyensis TaxID=97481 RepID=A0A1H7VSK2_9PAST|nr:YeeE/YedE thiosulfate transporter family protein [Pasteurella skyensis]MDP8078897.1 YeeE/YedE thiosulfate transporter family protein [Pasteurella skyensis]MDP8084790.1 YeeE/YedE thiosulfate transporter family protein [Pasteurella skyensis]MDP8184870.1 YeeE/YedE thiosulfate transporter family protein [Pasteurella skyensis]QLB22537.1 hypothetical protein A6B44_04700 [Pasteurella skyensis]SEM11859.1 hypothetical protein SAMN05444853_10589 [Pasteurella skyensis]
MKFVLKKRWGWKTSGIALALSFLLAVLLVKPIGVSTQFVILDGIIWNTVSPELVVKSSETKSGYASNNAYLNKSGGKYAKNIANPANYSFVFVLAMLFGGFFASKLSNKEEVDSYYGHKVSLYDKLTTRRFLLAFIGGFLALFGARLAGGCTSGHMMSGMMQTSLSGYLFAAAAFATAIPTALFFYKRGE